MVECAYYVLLSVQSLPRVGIRRPSGLCHIPCWAGTDCGATHGKGKSPLPPGNAVVAQMGLLGSVQLTSAAQIQTAGATMDHPGQGLGFRISARSWHHSTPQASPSTGPLSFASPCSILSRTHSRILVAPMGLLHQLFSHVGLSGLGGRAGVGGSLLLCHCPGHPPWPDLGYQHYPRREQGCLV